MEPGRRGGRGRVTVYKVRLYTHTRACTGGVRACLLPYRGKQPRGGVYGLMDAGIKQLVQRLCGGRAGKY